VTRRVLSLLVIVGLIAGACGGGASPAASGGAAPPSAAPPSAAPPSAAPPSAAGEAVTLKVESWRSDDLSIWQDKIIPAFEKNHPNIHVEFTPTSPEQYDPALKAKLDGGTAGDLMACRPFDLSLQYFDAGYLTSVNDLPGIDNFGPLARSPWSTDDGKTTFCVPMASVIHGFIYNKGIFTELGIEPPKTEDEFFAALDKIKASGKYTPLAFATGDSWTDASMGFNNIGPNRWKGEEGRLGVIKGTKKFTDPGFVDTWATLTKWEPYMPKGFGAVTYPDTQNLFSLGKAAIFPSGSWEISGFTAQAQFEMGAFPPPVPKAGDQCYISDEIDIAIGMNAKTAHPAEARTFLEWVAGSEFGSLYSNALPGFFSLNKNPVTIDNPLAQAFVSWRTDCKSTIRFGDQFLSRGNPSTGNELSVVTQDVINGALTPQQAGERLQKGLDSWYTPMP
jgi:raffinose/stachyose/melibiose transport system substrate-binding protein